MSERMTEDEIMLAWDGLAFIGRLLLGVPIDRLQREIEFAQSFGPFYDPTAWMRNNDGMRQNAEFLRAARPFWDYLQKTRVEVLGE